jgi:cyclophilin family peptidyl-prolyl cis-trans isomerase
VGAQTLTVSASGSSGAALATLNLNVPVPQVTMLVTNGAGVSGQLVITLSPELTPITVDNFLAYVNSGFYNDTIFHRNGRTSSGGPFVLQGGGYTGPVSSTTGLPPPKPTEAAIPLERGLSNLRYTVAMARSAALNSATSEFFINSVDNAFLDTGNGGYAAFGRITDGTELVDAMSAAPCTAGFFGVGNPDCLPEPNLTIVSAQQTR